MSARGRKALSLLSLLAFASCKADGLYVPLGEILEDDWLLVVTTDDRGAPVEVAGAFDLRRPAEVSVEAENDQGLVLVSFSNEELPFTPLSHVLAELAPAPEEPEYGASTTGLVARLAWPKDARLRAFDAEGRTAERDVAPVRDAVRLSFEYAGLGPVFFESFGPTAEYMSALHPLVHTAGSSLGPGTQSGLIQELVVVDDTRVVAMLPQVLVVFDRGALHEVRPYDASAPNRWVPITLLTGGINASFGAAVLHPEPAPSGERRLFVSGVVEGLGGRVWSFLLSETGLSFESTLDVRGATPAPALTRMTVDSEGNVLVGSLDLFLATKTKTATVFEPTEGLRRFVESVNVLIGTEPELTLLATSRRPAAPHVVGLGLGWIIEGNAFTGEWALVADVRSLRPRILNPHILSYVEHESGDVFVTSRRGGFYRRRLGGAFRALPLRSSSELAACATPDQIIEHHISALWLRGPHGFALSHDCTAALRIRLEDGHVSPVLPENTTAAEATEGEVRHKGAGGGERSYILGGYHGYIGVFDSPD